MKSLMIPLCAAAMGVLLMACTTVETTFLLKNSTPDTLSVEFYRGGTVDSDYTIPPNTSAVLLHAIDEMQVWPGLVLMDSIRVSGDAGCFVYHRDSASKSEIFYVDEHWSLEVQGGRFTHHSYTYTYEFTEGHFQ